MLTKFHSMKIDNLEDLNYAEWTNLRKKSKAVLRIRKTFLNSCNCIIILYSYNLD